MKLTDRKITLAVASFNGGGAERVMTMLANNFVSRGVSVDFIVLFSKGPYKEILDKRVNIIELTQTNDGKILRKLRAFFRLKNYLNKNPDTPIMVTLRSMNVFFAFTKIFTTNTSRLYVREADTFDEIDRSDRVSKKWFLKIIKYLYPKQAGVIANCMVTKMDLIRHMPLIENKVTVIYNPLDIEMIKASTINVVKSQKISLVACGRLVEKKNFKDSISALKMVKETYPDTTLTILGEGPQLENLKSQSRDLGLAESIFFPGFVDNPFGYFAKAHVFIQTSLYEGFGYVLAEAMAAGTPVVAYDGRGAMREILDNGRFGALVPLGNVELMAKAILSTIEHPVDEMRLLHNVNRFKSADIADKYFELIFTSASD